MNEWMKLLLNFKLDIFKLIQFIEQQAAVIAC